MPAAINMSEVVVTFIVVFIVDHEDTSLEAHNFKFANTFSKINFEIPVIQTNTNVV